MTQKEIKYNLHYKVWGDVLCRHMAQDTKAHLQ